MTTVRLIPLALILCAASSFGGVIYGISYMLMQSYYSSWANLLPYVLLIAILLVRPHGLFGRAAS